MKNIKEKGKTFKGKGKIFRQQIPAVCGERAAVAAHGFAPKVVFLAPKGYFVYKVAPFIYQNHYLCSRNTAKASNLIHIIYYMGLLAPDNNQQDIYFYKNERKHCETRTTFTNHRSCRGRLL